MVVVLVITVSSEAIFLIVARMSRYSFVGVNLFDVRFSFLVIVECGWRGYGRVGSCVVMMASMVVSGGIVSGGIVIIRAGVVNSSLMSGVRHLGRCEGLIWVRVSGCRSALLCLVALDQSRRETMMKRLRNEGRQRGESTEEEEVGKGTVEVHTTLICFSSSELWREPRYCLYPFASVSSRLLVCASSVLLDLLECFCCGGLSILLFHFD